MSDNCKNEDGIKTLAAEFKVDEYSRFRRDKSTKQLIKEICDAIIYIKNEKKYEGERNEWDVTSALNWLAIAAIAIFFFSVSRSDDSFFLEKVKLYAYILSVVFSAIWIGVNIERRYFFRELWKFGTTKIILSLCFTALVVFSTATASSTINNIFGVDASFFSFTRSFLTAFLFFKYASQLVYVLILAAAINLIPIFFYLKDSMLNNDSEGFPVKSAVFIVLTLMFSYFAWGWSGSNFDKQTLDAKVYLLAHQLDFNDSNLCENLIGENVSVIFLGQNAKKILVDFNVVKPDSFYEFLKGYESYEVQRKKIKVMPCD